jgi:hypothetical protein
MRQKPTQIIAELRRVRERCPIFNPLICTAATASILGITPRQLRYRHRDLADKSVHDRLRWRWSDVEAILAGEGHIR